MDTPKKSFSLTPRLSAMLCYLFPPFPVSSIVFLLVEKENKDVCFHAWQGTVLGATFLASLFTIKVAELFFRFIGIAFIAEMISLLIPVMWAILICVWIVCLIQAFRGERWKIPYLGEFAESRLKSIPING